MSRRNITMGDLFAETRELISGAKREVLVFVLAIGSLSALGVVLGIEQVSAFSYTMVFSFNASTPITESLFQLFVGTVSLVATYILLTRYLRFKRRMPDGQNRFWPYVGLSILRLIGIVVGLILLLVPGLFLMVRWSAASGFVIGTENGVTDSLRESWNATSGYGWTIFGTSLVLGIGYVVLSAIAVGILSSVSTMAGGVLNAYLAATFGTVNAAMSIAIYCLVHDDSQLITDVFS